MRKWFFIILTILLTGCSSLNPEQFKQNEDDSVPVGRNQQYFHNAEVLGSNLQIPWDIVKVDNQFLISERGGQIVRISENGQQFTMPLKLKKNVHDEGEGGLLGFILDPNFSSNSLAYIYHTYLEDGNIANRIVQVKKTGNGWEEIREMLSSLPGGRIHNGGRLEIGPENKLFITVGDAGVPESAQNLEVLSGKILRMNLDGSIPNDNPFKNSYIYSYGHRNPQGMAWDEGGKMYAAEHGQTAHDEINVIIPGGNYGWPVIQGDEEREGMIKPLFHSGNETWAPSGLAFNKGKLYVAALRGQQIRAFDLQARTSAPVFENVGRIRDLLVDDNYLYFITNNTDGRGSPNPNDDHLLRISLEDIK
ncbi:PQQ-dependent sugar dehydrogenase [Schinkia azotoformans]|nr:PQQ-dependent sugar dehydrogenase [Schinkia azotoformans]MEC1697950.1 PQQ-dependent sugar dehydrogenase [Schinkia azotoformans]MEC1717115.1 PQQ-dependent sugar dehydrogenase [Schinkia azotoformans]MEC1725178.1 PQQ-dependent sugar dehydrogenase [Schinkia azotoformans]MEC1741929.1 PQQ-dependent sugar dehydrogenase [Schinkia azotoformans]MEC1747297.1 PQQ-dependent sugar dehydrogenase [Schinkia azotoformans]